LQHESTVNCAGIHKEKVFRFVSLNYTCCIRIIRGGQVTMGVQPVTLEDRFNLTKSPVLLNGTQALVRLMLAQRERDRAAGLNTAGYVTGYRGPPLGAVGLQMNRAKKALRTANILFSQA